MSWNNVLSSASLNNLDGKMRQFDAILARLVNSVNGTLKQYERREDEDIIDHLHRLAQDGLGVDEISEIAGVPWYNVEYWMHSNGYDRHLYRSSIGVLLGRSDRRGGS